MVDEQEEQWGALNNEVGEALLDVERTFMNLVDLQAAGSDTVATAPHGNACVLAYLGAWGRLQGAHRRLSQFLVNKVTVSNRGSVIPALRRCR